MTEPLVITSPEYLLQLADLLQQASELVRQLSKERPHIPDTQAWFWSEQWQAMERAADEALARGEYKTFDATDDLIADLHTLV